MLLEVTFQVLKRTYKIFLDIFVEEDENGNKTISLTWGF
jgi:hypothetical protein